MLVTVYQHHSQCHQGGVFFHDYVAILMLTEAEIHGICHHGRKFNCFVDKLVPPVFWLPHSEKPQPPVLPSPFSFCTTASLSSQRLHTACSSQESETCKTCMSPIDFRGDSAFMLFPSIAYCIISGTGWRNKWTTDSYAALPGTGNIVWRVIAYQHIRGVVQLNICLNVNGRTKKKKKLH